MRSASRAARAWALTGSLGLGCRLGAGGLLGERLGGGLLLGDGLGVDLLGHGVADGDDGREAGLFGGGLRGERRGGGQGAYDAGGGESRDTRGTNGGAVGPARATVLPGGADERR
ncbi:hypothetical protein ACRAWF_04320 [Streptomyces sp. L7]